MSKPTPGPWRIQSYNPRDTSAVCDLGWNLQVGSNQPMDEPLSGEETHANARLIAAAPALLEAAKGAIQVLEEVAEDYYRVNADIDALKAAILQAEGRG